MATAQEEDSSDNESGSGGDEDGESEQEQHESSENSKEQNSETESVKAIANRKSKRTVKSNKMDDHIYYEKVGQARTAEQAGIKDEGKGPSKRHKTTEEQEQLSSESEGKADSDAAEEKETLTREDKTRLEELSKKKRQLKKERK